MDCSLTKPVTAMVLLVPVIQAHLLTASTVFLGKIEGVYRPTVAAIFPTVNGVRILIDAGANLTLKEEMYYQFAVMGMIFTREILKVENPKIGLLNVGEESEKGTELLKASYLKLKELDNFVGNIEGKDILNAKADVFLTDGFTGNILLKFGESIPAVMQKMVKEQLDLISADAQLQKRSLKFSQKPCIHLIMSRLAAFHFLVLMV